jgi:hypothetical protein
MYISDEGKKDVQFTRRRGAGASRVQRPVASFAHERLSRPIQNAKADSLSRSRDQTTASLALSSRGTHEVQRAFPPRTEPHTQLRKQVWRTAAGSCQTRPYWPVASLQPHGLARRVRPFTGRELTGLSRSGIQSVSCSGIADACPSYASCRSMAVRESTAAWVKMALVSRRRGAGGSVDAWPRPPSRRRAGAAHGFDLRTELQQMIRHGPNTSAMPQQARELGRTAAEDHGEALSHPVRRCPRFCTGTALFSFKQPCTESKGCQTPIRRRGAPPRRWILGFEKGCSGLNREP